MCMYINLHANRCIDDEGKERKRKARRCDRHRKLSCVSKLTCVWIYIYVYVAISRLTDHVKVWGHLRTERVCIYRKSEEKKKWKWWESSMTCKHCLGGYELLLSSYFLPCCCYYSVHQRYEWMNEAKKQKMKNRRRETETSQDWWWW